MTRSNILVTSIEIQPQLASDSALGNTKQHFDCESQPQHYYASLLIGGIPLHPAPNALLLAP